MMGIPIVVPQQQRLWVRKCFLRRVWAVVDWDLDSFTLFVVVVWKTGIPGTRSTLGGRPIPTPALCLPLCLLLPIVIAVVLLRMGQVR